MGDNDLIALLGKGGPIIWVIAALSLFTLTLIIWKALRLLRLGAWGGSNAVAAAEAIQRGATPPQDASGGLRYRAVMHAVRAIADPALNEAEAREETERFARRLLTECRRGLRSLEVIAAVAPLLGLLGTVLGMIEAFQALQQTGARADPSALAGGIWEALLTTAAGMGVAIPAALALAWFESVVEAVAGDMEDLTTRVFLARPSPVASAAE